MLVIKQILLHKPYKLTCYQLLKSNLYIYLLCCLSVTNHNLATSAYNFFMVKFAIVLEFYHVY